MSEGTKSDNKNILIFTGIIAVAILIGGYIYMQQKNTKTMSVSVGGKEISATISE